jgi:citrate lyase beta subunit
MDCSWLFIPVLEDKFVKNISNLNANVFVLDLEDAIPNIEKESAQKKLQQLYPAISNNNIAVRINHLSSPWGKNDVKIVSELGIRKILYPKSESSIQLLELKKLLDLSGHENCTVVPIIETKKGIYNINEILELSFIDTVIWGSEDLIGDYGISERSIIQNNIILSNALFEISKACIKKRKILIDCASPYFNSTEDLELLRKECIYSANFLALGKLAIHPNQIGIINEIYSNIFIEIENDINIIVDKMIYSNKSVIKHNNTLVGLPALRKFEKQIPVFYNVNSISTERIKAIESKIKKMLR